MSVLGTRSVSDTPHIFLSMRLSQLCTRIFGLNKIRPEGLLSAATFHYNTIKVITQNTKIKLGHKRCSRVGIWIIWAHKYTAWFYRTQVKSRKWNSNWKKDRTDEYVHQSPSRAKPPLLTVVLRRSVAYFSKYLYIKIYVNMYSKPLCNGFCPSEQVIKGLWKRTYGSLWRRRVEASPGLLYQQCRVSVSCHVIVTACYGLGNSKQSYNQNT